MVIFKPACFGRAFRSVSVPGIISLLPITSRLNNVPLVITEPANLFSLSGVHLPQWHANVFLHQWHTNAIYTNGIQIIDTIHASKSFMAVAYRCHSRQRLFDAIYTNGIQIIDSIGASMSFIAVAYRCHSRQRRLDAIYTNGL